MYFFQNAFFISPYLGRCCTCRYFYATWHSLYQNFIFASYLVIALHNLCASFWRLLTIKFSYKDSEDDIVDTPSWSNSSLQVGDHTISPFCWLPVVVEKIKCHLRLCKYICLINNVTIDDSALLLLSRFIARKLTKPSVFPKCFEILVLKFTPCLEVTEQPGLTLYKTNMEGMVNTSSVYLHIALFEPSSFPIRTNNEKMTVPDEEGAKTIQKFEMELSWHIEARFIFWTNFRSINMTWHYMMI